MKVKYIKKTILTVGLVLSMLVSPIKYNELEVQATTENSNLVNLISLEENIEASITNSKVIIDGKDINFEAYNINFNNYFKLRDIAYILTATQNQFDVTWDNDKQSINLLSNKPYTVIGGEMNIDNIDNIDNTLLKQAKLNKSSIYLNGLLIDLTSYTIEGNNYFKLRDLGELFGFEVDWDENINAIIINTSRLNNVIEYTTQTTTQTTTQYTTSPSIIQSTQSNYSTSTGLYITKTGKKYHYNGNCNGGTYISITLEELNSKYSHLEPCSKCVN